MFSLTDARRLGRHIVCLRNSTAISSFLKVDVFIFEEERGWGLFRIYRTIGLTERLIADNGVHCRLREFDHLTNGPLLSVTGSSVFLLLLPLCFLPSFTVHETERAYRAIQKRETIFTLAELLLLRLKRYTRFDNNLFLSSPSSFSFFFFFCFLFERMKESRSVHIIVLQIEIKMVLHRFFSFLNDRGRD